MAFLLKYLQYEQSTKCKVRYFTALFCYLPRYYFYLGRLPLLIQRMKSGRALHGFASSILWICCAAIAIADAQGVHTVRFSEDYVGNLFFRIVNINVNTKFSNKIR